MQIFYDSFLSAFTSFSLSKYVCLTFGVYPGEVTSGDRSDSPLIDIEGVSDEESGSRESVVGQSCAFHSTLLIM